MSPLVVRQNSLPMGRGSVLILILCGFGLAGCSLFDDSSSASRITARKLPALRAPVGSMQLDVVYVERPVGDPLLGQEFWRHVDQVGEIDAETRGRIRHNGFRVGVVGTNPPVALQKMLGLRSDFVSEPDAEQAKQLVGRRFFPVSGGEFEIQVSPLYRECNLNIDSGGSTEPRRFENAICKYRIRAVRLQDGWARLEFVPQVHFGDDHLRHVAGENGWRFQNGQQTETFFLQRFDLKLSTGTMAVITSDDDAPGTLGHVFFRGPAALRPPRERSNDPMGQEQSPPVENDYPIQRLLIIRLAGMDETEPVFRR